MPSSEPPERSPSPPPTAPTASTPGPRATAFITLYNNALSNTLKSISYDSFAACFPTIARQAPDSLSAMHSNFVERLERYAKDEFQNILLERSVITNLNALEDLLADAKRRKALSSTNPSQTANIPPHTIPAPTILSAHLAPLQTSQQSQLNAKIQTTTSVNAVLAGRLKEQRGELEKLVGVLEGRVRDLEEAGDQLQREGERLARGAREAEGALR